MGPKHHVLHVQKRLNRSICRFGCGFEWAEGCISSIVFARWCQCVLMEGHVAVTCRITLNHPSTAATSLVSTYFDHLLSLDTPTKTAAQIAMRFEPSTALHFLYMINFFFYCTTPTFGCKTLINFFLNRNHSQLRRMSNIGVVTVADSMGMFSNVARNSQWRGLELRRRRSVPFYSLPNPSSLSPYSLPYVNLPSSPSPPRITARGLGSAIAPPAGTGKARPPNAFSCNSEPKICKSVNVNDVI